MTTPIKIPPVNNPPPDSSGLGTPQFAKANTRAPDVSVSAEIPLNAALTPTLHNAIVAAVVPSQTRIAGFNPPVSQQEEKLGAVTATMQTAEESHNLLRQRAAADAIINLPEIAKIQAEAGHSVTIAAQGGERVDKVFFYGGERPETESMKTSLGALLVTGATPHEEEPHLTSPNTTPFAVDTIIGRLI